MTILEINGHWIEIPDGVKVVTGTPYDHLTYRGFSIYTFETDDEPGEEYTGSFLIAGGDFERTYDTLAAALSHIDGRMA